MAKQEYARALPDLDKAIALRPDYINALMNRGDVVYHSGVRVFHRRRAFPGPYLRQRWRYRVKTGREGIKDRRIYLFLLAGTITLLVPPLWIVYYGVTLILGARATRRPKSYLPLLPFAFALHHLTYYFGILWGLLHVHR